MNIKATFPAGVDTLTVHGLHQWDYGRKLEISAPTRPALVEVHFACAGAKDAVVRLASVADGVASVIIPDTCLEQTTPVAAWVYEVGADYGHTALTVILPVTARAKPTAETLPVAIGDKYTELIGHVNAAVKKLTDGTTVVQTSVNALHASKDSKQRVICDTYAVGSADYVAGNILPAPGLYHVRVWYVPESGGAGGMVDFGLVYHDGYNITQAVSGTYNDTVRLLILSAGAMAATGDSGGNGASTYYYKPMWLATSAAAASEEV